MCLVNVINPTFEFVWILFLLLTTKVPSEEKGLKKIQRKGIWKGGLKY